MAVQMTTEDAGARVNLPMRVLPAGVTVWDGSATCAFKPMELSSSAEKRARLRHLAESSPVWIAMNLATEPSLWLQPWEFRDADHVDWSAMDGLSQLLGFGLPSREPRPADSTVTTLHRLPMLNELAVLRWL